MTTWADLEDRREMPGADQECPFCGEAGKFKIIEIWTGWMSQAAPYTPGQDMQAYAITKLVEIPVGLSERYLNCAVCNAEIGKLSQRGFITVDRDILRREREKEKAQ